VFVVTDATGTGGADDPPEETDSRNGNAGSNGSDTSNGDLAADGETPVYRRVPWRRVASVVGVLVLVLVVLPFVVYLVPQAVGGSQSYVVLSGSMEPAIGPGDVIVVGDVAPAAIETGDVITFSRSGEARPTTHRVVEVLREDGGPAFRTAGDNNPAADRELVRPEQIEGRVLSVGGYLFAIPFVGRVILFASTQTGFLLLGIVPVSLFVVNELWTIVGSTRVPADGSTETEPTAPADGSTETEPTTAAKATAQSENTSGVTFTAGELKLGLAIAVVFLAYCVWVAYATVEIWAMGVAGAVTAMVLLLAGLFFLGGSGEPVGSDGPSDQSSPVEGKPLPLTDGTETGSSIPPLDGDGTAPDVQLPGGSELSSALEEAWTDPDRGGTDPPETRSERGDQRSRDSDQHD